MFKKKDFKFWNKEIGKLTEIDIYYSLGGPNYFSGGYNRRGIYIGVTPKTASNGMVEHSMFSGTKLFLEEMPRKKPKRLIHWVNTIQPFMEELCDVAEKGTCKDALIFLMDKLNISLVPAKPAPEVPPIRTMKLLTKEILDRFPKLGETEHKKPEEVEIIAKFFNPAGSWTWFAVEFDQVDTFFGMVHGFEKELGYFSLKELEGVKGQFGLGIERDRHYGKHFLSEVMEKQSA